VRNARVAAWAVLALAALYFLVPLFATAQFSLETPGAAVLSAYAGILGAPGFWHGLAFSAAASVATVAVGLGVVLPAVYWSRLKAPRLHAWVELVSLMSFVVPPIVLVFGVVSMYSGAPWPLSVRGVMLVGAYVVVALPYLFRAIDNGLASLNASVLTEAAQSLGASWWQVVARVILPNLRGSMLAGSFLTTALVMGEYAIASMLGFNNLGVYMLLVGSDQAQGAAALAILAFMAVWATIAAMHVLTGKDVSFGGGVR
jgi:putative spermidine/putrescine transport system permease protein